MTAFGASQPGVPVSQSLALGQRDGTQGRRPSSASQSIVRHWRSTLFLKTSSFDWRLKSAAGLSQRTAGSGTTPIEFSHLRLVGRS